MSQSHNINRSPLLPVILLTLAAQLFTGILASAYAADIPSYAVQFIGGSPKSVNNSGQAVGWVLIEGGQRGWVFTGGDQELLPVPDGWHSQANDINDSGVVVGNAGGGGGVADKAVQWLPDGNGYVMEDLGTPDGDSGSTAIAINNFGDIVGTRTYLTEIRMGVFTFVTRGFLSVSNGAFIENLSDEGFEALPKDINDAGLIVGGSVRMDTTTGVVEDLGVPTVPEGETRYALSFLNAINNVNQVAASTVLASSLDANRTASRYTDGNGWQVLSFIGSFDAAYGINDDGDVSFEASFLCSGGAASPGVFLDGIGTYCIQDLLADQNWVLHAATFNNDINNSDQILVSGSHAITGESGAVLLSLAGPLAPPAAPQNLAAIVHEADAQQPWNAIVLSWTDSSSNETGFRIERRISGDTAWVEIATVSAGTQSYSDRDIGSGITYDYQVIATGLAGDSVPSNIISATSPETTVDTEAPVVSFLSPGDGDEVSGNVGITVQATDNIAVTNVAIQTLVNSSLVTICNVSDPTSDTVSCTWRTKKLASGVYPLNTTVSDAQGNFSNATINVNFVAATKGGGKGGGGKCNPRKENCSSFN